MLVNHLLEQIVASPMCQRRESQKLKVREVGRENHIGGNVEFNRVLAKREFVEEVPGRDGEPLNWRDRTCAPNQTMRPREPVRTSEEGDLGLAELVQGAKAGHRAPGAVAAKTGDAQIADGAGEFGQR